VKREVSVVPHKEARRKPWEPMTLTPVGDLGVVIQDMNGSMGDGGGGGMMVGNF
jgi:hypothetical protein